jgi:hypothetical protein
MFPGLFVPNTNSEWINNYYYKKVIPTYKSGTYYTQVISNGVKVPKTDIIMNTYETMQAWRDCLSNGKFKLLKSPNGQSWVVSISEPTSLSAIWNAKKYPSSIEFNWQEVLDKDKISIIKW